MTPWEWAMLGTGLILGTCLGLIPHIRWLRRQACTNARIEAKCRPTDGEFHDWDREDTR